MIPFFDLAAQQTRIRHQIDENIAKVLAHGKYIPGPEVAELEERLCDYTELSTVLPAQMGLMLYK